jgi:hypothetical protein
MVSSRSRPSVLNAALKGQTSFNCLAAAEGVFSHQSPVWGWVCCSGELGSHLWQLHRAAVAEHGMEGVPQHTDGRTHHDGVHAHAALGAHRHPAQHEPSSRWPHALHTHPHARRRAEGRPAHSPTPRGAQPAAGAVHAAAAAQEGGGACGGFLTSDTAIAAWLAYPTRGP